MADYPIPKINTAYIFYVGLVSQADTKLLKANPTLAAGDVKVSIDGGAFANLGTLPAVSPASGTAVKVTMAAGEMNGDNIVVAFIDAAGAEWCDQLINIQTAARGVADLAFPATTGRSMVVDANGLVDGTTVKIGPTGAGTAQTAGDLMGARAEPAQGAPAASASFLSKVDYLYKAWRNKKTKTATATNYFNDDAATVDHKTADTDDGTTGTRGEVASGP